jgi:hypothetical protein
MRSRRFVVLSIAGALALGPVAFAVPAHAAAKSPSAVKVAKTAKVSKVKNPKAVAAKAKASARKVARFNATGSAVSVDPAGTLVVAVKGGDRNLRRRTVTVAVDPTAKISLNNVPATLADIPAGAHVKVSGTRSGESLLAFKVHASTG